MTSHIVDMTSSCRPCHGRGIVKYDDCWEACDHCGGSGRESVRVGPKRVAEPTPELEGEAK